MFGCCCFGFRLLLIKFRPNWVNHHAVHASHWKFLCIHKFIYCWWWQIKYNESKWSTTCETFWFFTFATSHTCIAHYVSLVYQNQHQHQQRRIFGNNQIHFSSRLWNVYKCKMCKILSQISMSVYAWMYVFFIIFAKAFCLIPYSFSFNLPAFHVHNFMNCYSMSCCVLQFCCSRCRFLFISNSLLNRHHMIDWIK